MTLATRLKRLEARLPPPPISPRALALARIFTPIELKRIDEARRGLGSVPFEDLLKDMMVTTDLERRIDEYERQLANIAPSTSSGT